MSETDTTCTCPSGDGSLRWPCPTHPPTERDERLRGIQERLDAATEGPWSITGIERGDWFIETPESREELERPVAEVHQRSDAAFIAAARTDVPWLLAEVARLDAVVTAQAATIRKLVDWDIVEDSSWLGSMATQNVEGEEPGNEEYMAYINRVLTAGGYDGTRWGPILLAIVLDRAVRETEKAKIAHPGDAL